MGEKVVAGRFDLSDRQRYRDKLRRCLTGLERLLAERHQRAAAEWARGGQYRPAAGP